MERITSFLFLFFFLLLFFFFFFLTITSFPSFLFPHFTHSFKRSFFNSNNALFWIVVDPKSSRGIFRMNVFEQWTWGLSSPPPPHCYMNVNVNVMQNQWEKTGEKYQRAKENKEKNINRKNLSVGKLIGANPMRSLDARFFTPHYLSHFIILIHSLIFWSSIQYNRWRI